MQKTIGAIVYFILATVLIMDGLIVKYFLVDTDLGARFKNFNHSLLSSDIIFIYALFLAIIGLIFQAIRKNKRSTLKDSTVIISVLLVIPISLVLAVTPILETLYPGEVGDHKLGSWFIGLTSIGTLAAMAWIVMIPVILLKQTINLLTGKIEKPKPGIVNNNTHSTESKQFKIKENGFIEIRKQIIIRSVPLLLISGTVGLLIFVYSPANTINSEASVLPYIIPLILVFFALGTINVLRRQKAIYKSYVLKIDDSSIIRQQAHTPTISILFAEISSIRKSIQGGLVITGNNRSNMILIPAQLEELDVLENILGQHCTLPISTSKPQMERLMIPLILVVLGLMATTYISTNKILASVSGILLIGFMIISFIKIQTNKNVDEKTRRSSYWVIVVILSLIGIIVSKWMS